MPQRRQIVMLEVLGKWRDLHPLRRNEIPDLAGKFAERSEEFHRAIGDYLKRARQKRNTPNTTQATLGAHSMIIANECGLNSSARIVITK